MASDSTSSTYRSHLPDLTTPRFAAIAQCDAYSHAQELLAHKRPPWLYALIMHLRELFTEQFKGVTTDGVVRQDLFKLRDEGIPIASIVDATSKVLDQLSEAQKAKTLFHIDSHEWRSWSNPEFLISDKGVRLDEVNDDLRNAIMGVLKLTLSPEGYEKAVGAMRINGFLGELVKAPKVMNEFSYNFCIFGTPSTEHPWGFSFYGHHLCLSIFLYKSQIIISPWFTGAEPNIIDDGPHKGTRILFQEEELGLQLMQSLELDQQHQARVYDKMKDEKMPEGRWNHDDQRHLCGAYRDNRVVPYEGILVSFFTKEQKELVLGILNQYFLYLPKKARELKLQDAKKWFHETYFCWIGGLGDNDPFYYRIQSPVIIVEFDHHSGVFLTNSEPEKFHIHTLLRTPNGGDYGYALKNLMTGREQDFVWEE